MEYNNYPESFDENGKLLWSTRPRQLKRGEKVEYQLIDIKNNVLDPTGKTKAIPYAKGIRKRQNVFIPFPEKAKEELKKEGDTRDGVYIDIKFGNDRPGEDLQFKKSKAGLLTVTGGTSLAQQMFEFLETCNDNISNPNRIKEKQPVFEKVDNKAKAKRERELRSERAEARSRAESLKRNELNRVAIGMGRTKPNEEDEDVLRNIVEAYAESNPLDFLMKIENTDLVIYEIASIARDKGLLNIDMQKRAISGNSGSTLYTWKPEKDVNWLEKFAEFVKSKEGEEFYSSLKEQLKIR